MASPAFRAPGARAAGPRCGSSRDPHPASRRVREYWRWPTIRLNQFNWHLLVFAGVQYRQRRRCCWPTRRHYLDLPRGHGRAAENLGPGLRFHYLPHERADHPMNVDSAEYAEHRARPAAPAEAGGRGRHAASAPASASREWVRRAVPASSDAAATRTGIPGWLRGLADEEALALQQALIGVAATEESSRRAWGAWTKWLLDRSLAWRQRDRVRRPPADPITFGVNAVPLTDADAALAATRIAANAATVFAAGLGTQSARRRCTPYALTPATSPSRPQRTAPAIVAVNQGPAFPYGRGSASPGALGRSQSRRRGDRRPSARGASRLATRAARRPHRPRVTGLVAHRAGPR